MYAVPALMADMNGTRIDVVGSDELVFWWQWWMLAAVVAMIAFPVIAAASSIVDFQSQLLS